MTRQVIAETNQVINLFNQALAQNNYNAAWQQVAEAVGICRIDTLPRATQAVRDAGLVGTVRVRVVDQAGRPLPGAFATVLTAHTPIGARAPCDRCSAPSPFHLPGRTRCTGALNTARRLQHSRGKCTRVAPHTQPKRRPRMSAGVLRR